MLSSTHSRRANVAAKSHSGGHWRERVWPCDFAPFQHFLTSENRGVGFGICHRLLIQLCQPCPSDAKPAPALGNKDVEDGIEPCESLTLIMACRSVKRGEAARAQLFRLLDEHLAKLQQSPKDIAYAKRFRQNVRIDLQYLDLASVSTIFRLGAELRQK